MSSGDAASVTGLRTSADESTDVGCAVLSAVSLVVQVLSASALSSA